MTHSRPLRRPEVAAERGDGAGVQVHAVPAPGPGGSACLLLEWLRNTVGPPGAE